MIFYPEERIAIFIDGANLYSAARGLAFDIDYKRLLDLFRSKGRLIRAFYYTALVEDQEYSPIRPLVDWLDYNGYTMVTNTPTELLSALPEARRLPHATARGPSRMVQRARPLIRPGFGRAPDRRAGARAARRQSHRAPLYWRLCRRPAVPDPAEIGLCRGRLR